jgi:pimeloyl-ACP methyl ester carboxylesterase
MLFGKEKSFEQIYAGVPQEQIEKIIAFREKAAYQQIKFGEGLWQYRVLGRGDKTIIFLPGSFTLADLWMQIALAFEQDYRILLPDAYARQELFDISTVVKAILGMMDAEGVKEAIFIGLGAGGDLAQYILHQHPQRVSHLILSHCDILGDATTKDDVRHQRTIGFYKRTAERTIRKLMLRQLESKLSKVSDWHDFTIAYYRESIQGLKKNMVLGYVKHSYEMKKEFEFSVSRIQHWSGKMLYLASEDDLITLESITPLKKFYSKAKVHRFVCGQNHVHMLFAEQFVQVINEFFQDTDTRDLPQK